MSADSWTADNYRADWIKVKEKKKTPPRSTSTHLDNPDGGALELGLLYARLDTIREDREAAMSAHDIRNGYSPETIIRLLTRQILAMLKNQQAILESGALDHWVDRRGAKRPSYLLRDEIAQLEKQLTTMMTKETPQQEKSPSGGDTQEVEEGGGAVERLGKISEIRRAIFLLRAQLKTIRKTAKEKTSILESGLVTLLDDVDDKQLFLFDLPAEVSEECQAILDDPSL